MLDPVPVRPASAVLVGRDGELGQLADAYKRARAGEAATVLVGGEAGVGKSRLVSEFAARAVADRVPVFAGQCLELGEDGLPFAPFAGVLRDVRRQLGPDVFAGHEGEFARLVPELAPPGPAASDLGRGHLFDLVAGLFERLTADRPLVLVVEDLHWADRSTRELVGFLVRSGRAAGSLVVGTHRSDELRRGHPLRSFLAELERVRTVERIELDRLDRDDTATLLANLRGRPPAAHLVDTVYARSQGNPFFVEELATCSDGDRPLPDTLRDLLLTRVDELGEVPQRILRVAAAGGNRIGHRLLATVAGVDDAALDEALRAAVAAQLVVAEAGGETYEFRHALVREAVHDDLLPGEHRRLHARYATAIEADPSLVGADRAPSEIAYHWYAAHDDARALHAAARAADVAGQGYAFAEERRLRERVLELWDQVPDAADRLGTDRLAAVRAALAAAINAGDHERALGLARAALAELDAESEPLMAGRLLEMLGRMLRTLGRSDGAAELREAYQLTAGLPDDGDKTRLHAALASGLMLAGDAAEAGRMARLALAVAEARGDAATQVDALVTMGRAALARSYGDGLALMRRAAELAAGAGDLEGLVRARVNISDVLTEMGRYAEAEEVARVGVGDARRLGVGRIKGVYLLGNQVDALVALGRWDDADELCGQILRLDPPGTLALLGLSYRALVRLRRGTADAADAVARAVAYLTGPYLHVDMRLELLGLGIEAAGPDAAVRAHAALDDPDVTSKPRYGWPLLATAARAAAGATTTATAGATTTATAGATTTATAARTAAAAGDRALRDRVAALADGFPARHPAELAHAADVAAVLAGGGDAVGAHRAAVAAWRVDGQPYELARALLGLAEAEAMAAGRAACAAAIDETVGIAAALGTTGLLAAAATMARRVGIRPGGVTPPAPATTLTSREREVLRLIAEGRSNRRIAETLYISPKTASVHVSRIIAKLEVSSRGEAAATARRLGLLGPE